MTEQIQILQRRLLGCIARGLKVLWMALKVLSVYLGGNRRWVSLSCNRPRVFALNSDWLIRLSSCTLQPKH